MRGKQLQLLEPAVDDYYICKQPAGVLPNSASCLRCAASPLLPQAVRLQRPADAPGVGEDEAHQAAPWSSVCMAVLLSRSHDKAASEWLFEGQS